MKILFCSITYGKDIFAGMENAAFNFVQGMKETGHSVCVFTGTAYIQTGYHDGVKVVTSQYLPNKFPCNDDQIITTYTKNKKQISEDLHKVICNYKPDLVLSWDPLWGIIQYMDKNLFENTRTATVFHVISSLNVLEAANRFNYDSYFVVSEYLKTQLCTRIKHPLIILPNSINFSLYNNTARQKEKTIIINGRLSPEKGIDYAVKACIKFLKLKPDYKLILFDGDFPFGDKTIVKDKIMSLLTASRLEDRVIWLQNVPWDKIPNLLIRSSIIILPSLFESFGIAALEALASGTQLICTNVGNLPRLVENAAVLVKPKSIKSIYSALNSISEPDISNKDRINKARQIAKKYDRKTVAKHFIIQIKEVL